MWIATTRIGLPVMEEREVWKGITAPVATGESVTKERGDRITKTELESLGWPDEKITEDMAELSTYGSVTDSEGWKKLQEAEEAAEDAARQAREEQQAKIDAAAQRAADEARAQLLGEEG